MRFLSRYIALGFALVFMLSGAVNGYAHGMMAGAHNVQICAELGYNSITLGANGEKLPKLHDCSSCCVAVGLLHDAPPPLRRSQLAQLLLLWRFEPSLGAGVARISLWPRGPPFKG